MTELHIARNFYLPLETVAQPLGILAQRGAGKSNAAVVMAEEMFEAGLPWIAIDPKGDWHGIRSSRDGKKPGLPVPVFGGLHADVPLHPDGGALLADLIVDVRLTCIVDVSDFSKGEQTRFLIDLGERLFRKQRHSPEPMHVFMEEAHEYLPQRVMRDQARLVGAWAKIVKQGRSFGLGVTVVSQRSASLNKDVLTQVGTLIVLRTTSPQDRKAIKDWVDEYDVDKEMLSSLPGLEDGEAWIWSPQFLKVFKRVKFRQRTTFDSGATPKLGQVRTPTTLADIDLDAIQEKWAESIERAKEDDPKELKKRLRDLEQELKQRPEVEPEVQTVYSVPDELGERLLKLEDMANDTMTAARRIEEESSNLAQWMKSFLPVAAEELRRQVARVTPIKEVAATQPARPAATAPRGASGPSDSSLGAMERKLLSVIIQHAGVSQAKLLILSNYKVGGSYYRAMKNLRDREYVTTGSPIRSTQAGRDAVGYLEPLPSGDALFDWWKNHMGGMGTTLLTCLRESSDGLSQEELLGCSGYKVGGSYYRAMKSLRDAGLVTSGAPIRLSHEFAEAIR